MKLESNHIFYGMLKSSCYSIISLCISRDMHLRALKVGVHYAETGTMAGLKVVNVVLHRLRLKIAFVRFELTRPDTLPCNPP